MNLVTIVPPEPTESGLTLTNGTRVLLADGTPLEGVTRIVLTLEPNGIWTAQIDCNIRATELPNVLAKIEATAFPEGEQP